MCTHVANRFLYIVMPCAMIDMFSVIRLIGREYSVFGELLPISSDSIFFSWWEKLVVSRRYCDPEKSSCLSGERCLILPVTIFISLEAKARRIKVEPLACLPSRVYPPSHNWAKTRCPPPTWMASLQMESMESMVVPSNSVITHMHLGHQTSSTTCQTSKSSKAPSEVCLQC